jgi:hypothetical protein
MLRREIIIVGKRVNALRIDNNVLTLNKSLHPTPRACRLWVPGLRPARVSFVVRPYMRTLGWLIILLLNLGIATTFAPLVFDGEAPVQSRTVGAMVTLLFFCISSLLIAARFHRSPSWAHPAMKILCWAVPVLWLLGSLDYGMVSGLEFLSLIFAAAIAWASWRAFLFFPSQPNPPLNPDAPPNGGAPVS